MSSIVNKHILFSIIAIIAAIFAGAKITDMVYSAKMNSLYNEFHSYKEAINQFKDKYDYFPGDFPNASKIWPTAKDGNGNGRVEELELEDINAWNHLYLSGMIEKKYSGHANYTNRQYIPGKNVPKSKYLPNSMYVFKYVDKIYTTRGNAIIFAQPGNRGYPTEGAISSDGAARIDYRFDDKLPYNGDINTVAGEHSEGCVKKDLTGYYSEYLWTKNLKDCVIYYWISRNK